MFTSNGKDLFFMKGNFANIKTMPYTLSYSMDTGFYLTESDEFKQPDKIYGDADDLIDRILYRFNSDTNSVGAYFLGEKGSGKTLHAQLISIKSKLPIILIKEKYTGNSFVKFIESLPECVVFFDEWDKFYKKEEEQSYLLGLLEQKQVNKKLFLFTANENLGIDYFFNRPSRIFYFKQFTGLSKSEITEIAKDKIKSSLEEDLQSFLDLTDSLSTPNYDVVCSIIKEMNLLKTNAYEASKYMNIKKKNIYKAEVKCCARYGKEEIIREITFDNILTDNEYSFITIELPETIMKAILFNEENFSKNKTSNSIIFSPSNGYNIYKDKAKSIVHFNFCEDQLSIDIEDYRLNVSVKLIKLS